MTVGSIEQALLKAKSLIKKKLFAEAGVVYRDILERFPNNRHAREGLLQLASS